MEIAAMGALFVIFILFTLSLIPNTPAPEATNFCPQPSAIAPSDEFAPSKQFYDELYREKSIKLLQGAVQIPTQTFDDMDDDPSLDSRFEPFADFHAYLASNFPAAWKFAETVNTYGLLYTIPGRDAALKPLVLMAHQDVVPVNPSTLNQWTHEPFSGKFIDTPEGGFLWGRGSGDTKNTLIAILEAAESLLTQKWQPERTVLLSFGFDEEISGRRGAGHLSELLMKRYGYDSVSLLVDEGFGLSSVYGADTALVNVGEKGYIDITVDLSTPGGHSSVPPDHTGIGIVAALVKQLEASPFPPELSDSNPTLGMMRCLAEHAPRMSKEYRRTILDLDSYNHREKLVESIAADPALKYSIRTSQAVDKIRGGIKVNALPENVELVVNHRIATHNSVAYVIDRMESIVEDLAAKFDLGVTSMGETVLPATPNGLFTISTNYTLEPSPLAPHSGPVWDLLAGTTRHVFNSSDRPVIVAPSIMMANTDTRYYWGITHNIFRFSPGYTSDLVNIHTVDEHLGFRSHLTAVVWFYELMQNAASSRRDHLPGSDWLVEELKL